MVLLKLKNDHDLHYWPEKDRVAWRLVNHATGRVLSYESPSDCFTLDDVLNKVNTLIN